jgi:hypothetical protein
MSQVKAKLVCVSVTPTEGEQRIVKFQAVTTGSEENKSFSRWTPSANLEMYISNETPAGEYFEQGKEYYLNFEAAE